MAFQPTFRMVRAEDQLVLDVALEGMTISAPALGGRLHELRLADPKSAGRIRLTFPPQQVLEYAENADGRLFQPKPIFSAPTTVLLIVPPGTPPVPATVAGVLDLSRRMELVTDSRAGTVSAQREPAPAVRLPAAQAVAATRAAMAGRPTDPALLRRRAADRGRRGAATRAPIVVTEDDRLDERRPGQLTGGPADAASAPGGTSDFALPYLLVIRPPGGDTRLTHPAKAVDNEDRYALWTSALGVTTGARTIETTLDVLFRATVQAANPTPEWTNIVDDNKLKNAVKASTAGLVAPQTDPALANPSRPNDPTQPAQLRRLRLSSLGGWLELNGRWPAGPDIKRLAHSTAMGRDQSQLVVKEGFLYPFNFKATATSQTVRFIEKGSSRVAALHTVENVVIDDPVALFGSFVDQPGWPYRQITCLTTETGPGSLQLAKKDGVASATGAEIFTFHGRAFEYQMSAIDRTGNEVTFALPLIFVPKSKINDSTLPALWKAQGTTFTDIPLGGQPTGMAPATPEDEAADLAEPANRLAVRAAVAAENPPVPTAAQATTVLAETIRFDIVAGKAALTHVQGIVPSLDKVLPGQSLLLSYASEYVAIQFKDAGGSINNPISNVGKTFLRMAQNQAQPVVSLGRQVAGELRKEVAGLAAAALPIAALSRKYGAVAGAAADIAKGDLNLDSIIKVGDTLLGILPLKQMFPAAFKIKITDENYKLTTDVQDGIATMDLTFITPLFGGANDHLSAKIPPFALLQPLRPLLPNGQVDQSAPNKAKLTIKQHTETDLDGNVRARNETLVEMVELQVLFQDKPVVTVPFKKASFTSVDGKKPDPDIDLGRIRFGGILELLARLAEIIDDKGFNDPPAVAVTENGVTSSFSIAVPALSIGMFALENISFGAALSLSFAGDPLTLDLNFATPDNPFRVAVAALGGGGSLSVGLSTKGLESVAGMLEFGASISIDLFIARASAEVMGGVSFLYQREPETGSLTAFLRIHGEVDILSLISICVELLVTLEYQFTGQDAGKLTGEASVAVEIKTIFFSETVTARTRQKFAGSNGDPTFAELMALAGSTGELPWNLYCAAFSED